MTKRLHIDLPKFDYHDYYKVKHDRNAQNNDDVFVKLTTEGAEKISSYYANKYKTNMEIFPVDTSLGYSLETIEQNLKQLRARFAGQLGEFRKAFIVHVYDGEKLLHSLPIIYLKSDDKEILFFADSLGSDVEANSFAQEKIIKKIAIDEKRQKDTYSCHTDAMTLARDCTAVNPDGSYLIPDLISLIEERAVKRDGIWVTQLPDELLKIVQSQEFLQNHQQHSDRIVHQNIQGRKDSLNTFFNHYPETMLVDDPPVSGYLRKKGHKYADMIEIQFYLEYLKDIFESDFSGLENKFIQNAKKYLKEKPPLTPENVENSSRLYGFVKSFIESNLDAEVNDPQPKTKRSRK